MLNTYLFVPRPAVMGIGSTDAKRLAAGEWDKLFDEKTGAVLPVDLSQVWKPRLGLETENLHAWWHAMRECTNDGERLVQPPIGKDGKSMVLMGMVLTDDSGMLDPSRPSCFTSIDRWVNEADCPLELKHTHGLNSLRNCATDYMAQIQWQLMVTARPRLRFSIIVGNSEPEWGYVDADEDYQARLLGMARTFWGMVIAGTRPEPLKADAELKAKAPTIKVNGTREYDATNLPSANEFIDKAIDYIAQKQAADKFKTTNEELRALIPADAGLVVAGGLTCKRDKRGAVRITIDGE